VSYSTALQKKVSPQLMERVRDVVQQAQQVLPFDELAAEVYGPLGAGQEMMGGPVDEPDWRIASIALSRDLTLVTGNGRHFERIPDLRIENWMRG
jgi:tRNA(fMet)-specific endonuclease VapC